MATGYSRSIEGRHDVIYDYCCTTCEGENLNAEALYYCKDCSQLYCEPCNKYHDKFFKTHQVFGRTEVAKWGNAKPAKLSLMCDEHPGKELEIYCKDHECVCCHTCISVNHRSCRNVQPVSQASKGIQQKSEFKTFLFDVPKTQSRLKTLHEKQENNIKMMQKARGEITFAFKTMRKKFNQTVDKLEEESTKEMDRLLNLLKEQVTTDKDVCSDVLNKIQKLLHDIQTLGKQCDELAFQGYKQCSEQMARGERLLSSMQDLDYKLKFTPDVSIEQHLSSLETLGNFQVTPSHLVKLKSNTHTKPSTPPDHIYTIKKKQTYNVRTRKDTKPCYISGMCQLPAGKIAIVDSKNFKVKLLSTYKYSVVDELELPPEPKDICHTTERELAVTVYDYHDRQEIQFINAGNGKMTYTRTVKLDHECSGIAHHDGHLYVDSEDALFAYNLSGKKIKKLYEDKSSSNFSTVERFSLSDDGNKIYLINNDKSLFLTLDSSGNQLSSLRDPDTKLSQGVCVADNGTVFVSSFMDNTRAYTILQVDSEGKTKMNTLITGLSEIVPESLFYDRKSHTLLIGKDNDNLLAMHLK